MSGGGLMPELLPFPGGPPPPPPTRADDSRPVYTVAGDLNEDATAAIRMIHRQSAAGVPLFERSGLLVEIAHTGEIVILKPDRIRDVLSKDSAWVRVRTRETSQGTQAEYRATYPPRDVCTVIAARTAWGLPDLSGVVSHPWLRCDGPHAGELVTEAGYDALSGTWGTWDPAFGAAVASAAEAAAPEDAVAVLLDLLADFRFAAPSHQSSALAAWLTCAARPGLTGNVPLWLVDASTPGSGKGTICDLVLRTIYPNPTRRTPWVHDDAELSKALLSLAVAGVERLLWDNVDATFGGAALDAAITSAEAGYQGRILGQTRIVSAPLRPFWAANGNNVAIKGDMHRRILVTRLDPGTDRPEERTDYRYPGRLLDVAIERRASVLGCCLRLLRHGIANPGPPIGSFESWGRVVRGALMALGYPDPWSSGAEVRERHRSDTLTDVAAAWLSIWGTSPVAARALGDAAADPPSQSLQADAYAAIADGLLEVAADRRVRGRVSSKRLGAWLARMRDRVVRTPDGSTITIRQVLDKSGRPKRGSGGMLWRVERLGTVKNG